jgi:hypothetical protein
VKGVEDALGRLGGVRRIQVDLQTNLVRIHPDERFELRLEEIPRAVRRAGFVPGEMTVHARGSYEVEDGQVAFRIRGWTRALPIRAELPLPQGETLLRARWDDSTQPPALRPLGAGDAR